MRQFLYTLALLAALTSGASAAATPAKKASLTKTNRECDGTATEIHKETFGFVNLVKTGSNMLVATIVLQGGPPNKSFNVRLIQIPGPVDCGPCTNGVNTLTTDSRGNGNLNVQQTVNSGVTSAFVALNNNDNCNDYFTIDPLLFL